MNAPTAQAMRAARVLWHQDYAASNPEADALAIDTATGLPALLAERVLAARVMAAARAVLEPDPHAQPLAYGRAIHALTEAVAACDSEPASARARTP